MTRAGKVVIIILLVAGVATATLIGALVLSSRLAQTSDSAQSFVAGHEIVCGNILLRGWHVPLDDYYFTDTAAYAALEWLLGPRPPLLALVPALTYVLFVCSVLVTCLKPSEPVIRNFDAALGVTLMLAAPAWIGAWNPLLMSDMHFATILGAFIALSLCGVVVQFERGNGWDFAGVCTALVVAVVATIASDPFSLVFAFGPALAVLSVDAILRPAARNERFVLLLLAGGTAFGFFLPSLVALAGGFTTEDIVKTGFASWTLIGRNLIALVVDFLTLFGANPIRTGYSLRVVPVLAPHLATLALAVFAFSRTVRRLLALDRAALLDRFLCAGALTALASCALSIQFGKGIAQGALWTGGPTMRYAMPAALFASVLGARVVPEMLSVPRGPQVRNFVRSLFTFIVVVTVIANGSITMATAPRWTQNSSPEIAARWLEQNRLSEGVGEYWSSNLVTAMSGDSVSVRSVVPYQGRLVDYVLAADRSWYARPPQFAIWQDNNQTNMTFAEVRATYVICQLAFVAGYRIAVLAHGKGVGDVRLGHPPGGKLFHRC